MIKRDNLELKATKEVLDETYKSFSDRVNALVKEIGMGDSSHQVIADFFGIPKNCCRGVLSNVNDIPVADMMKIAEALETTPDYLLFGLEKDRPVRKRECIDSPSVYERMFISRENMITMLLEDILPSLTEEEKETVLNQAKLLAKV